MRKIYTIISLVIILILLIACIMIFFISYETQRITAIEGKVYANSIAYNWSENATLISVRIASTIGSGGYFTDWYYKFIDTTIITNETECIQIKITYDGGQYITYNASIGPHTPIFDWRIDSNDAYEIALANEDIYSFMAHNPMVDGFFLSNASGIPTWYIDWTYDAGFDNPKWAEIQIDATTGEVLYVEADD